jgi:hypothetical protein
LEERKLLFGKDQFLNDFGLFGLQVKHLGLLQFSDGRQRTSLGVDEGRLKLKRCLGRIPFDYAGAIA